MLNSESIHSIMPQDIPWADPSHAVFFGVLYLVIGVIGCGLAVVAIKSFLDGCKNH